MRSLISLLIGIFIIWGCSTPRVGEREMVQSSSDKPDWLSDSRVFERTDDKLVFETTSLGRKNLDIARDEAENSLRLDIAERLNTDLSAEFWRTYAANNREDGMLQEEVAGAVKTKINELTIMGFSATDVYWEKYEIQEEYGVGYRFDVYVRGDITLSEYNRLYKQALLRLEGSDRDDLKETAKQLLQKLNN